MSNPASVSSSAPGSEGICIAFSQNAYTGSPTWTRIDDPRFGWMRHRVDSPFNGHFAAAWSTSRGRSYEIDKTQTGTAEVKVFDTTGYLDPTNPASPFYGGIRPNLPAKISVENPSTSVFYDIFRGFIESWSWTMDTAEKLMTLTISMVDGFELLSRGEIQPQASGVTTFNGDNGLAACQGRIDTILDMAGWPNGVAHRRLNSGNVFLQQTVYNPQTSFLSAIQDIGDAEFPGVANFFIDKSGAATFYGRYPRFQPTNYPDDINFWQAVDKSGQALVSGAANIADITWELDSKNVINRSACWPFGILQKDIYPNQIVSDSTSADKYGWRDLTLPDLINGGQPASASQPALGPAAACALFATYYVQCYAEPQLRISNLVFRSRPPGDSQTWALMTGVEIGDILTIYTTNPGGGGFFQNQFFVEGIHNNIAGALQEDIPEWEMTLDVSPRAWFPNDFPIGGTP